MNLKQMIFKTMNFNSIKRIVLALMLISVSMVSVQAQLLYKIKGQYQSEAFLYHGVQPTHESYGCCQSEW